METLLLIGSTKHWNRISTSKKIYITLVRGSGITVAVCKLVRRLTPSHHQNWEEVKTSLKIFLVDTWKYSGATSGSVLGGSLPIVVEGPWYIRNRRSSSWTKCMLAFWTIFTPPRKKHLFLQFLSRGWDINCK